MNVNVSNVCFQLDISKDKIKEKDQRNKTPLFLTRNNYKTPICINLAWKIFDENL